MKCGWLVNCDSIRHTLWFLEFDMGMWGLWRYGHGGRGSRIRCSPRFFFGFSLNYVSCLSSFICSLLWEHPQEWDIDQRCVNRNALSGGIDLPVPHSSVGISTVVGRALIAVYITVKETSVSAILRLMGSLSWVCISLLVDGQVLLTSHTPRRYLESIDSHTTGYINTGAG